MSLYRGMFVFFLMVAFLPLAVQGGAGSGNDTDQALLKEAGFGVDAPALLDFFRKRADGLTVDCAQLIRQLGDKRFNERDQAMRALISAGRPALPLLRAALKDNDLEVVRRAQKCINDIVAAERAAPPAVLAAAARLVARRAPDKAAAALLAYLPAAPTGEAEEETWRVLETLAGQPGTLHPAVAEALKDDSAPVRRAVAAGLAGRLGSAPQKEAVRKLLDDPVPLVRLRAAQGLLTGGDAKGVPTLIALLDAPAIDLAWQAEELLHWLAGADSPVETVGAGSAEERRKCRAAWQVWHKEQGPKVDLARLLKEPRRPGLFLVYESRNEPNPIPKREDIQIHGLSLYGCDSTPRWRIKGLPDVRDFHWLPEGRVLIVEGPWSVTERDVRGKVVWEHSQKWSSVLRCQRLPDGNTFLSLLYGMEEVTPEGVVSFSHRMVDAIPEGGSPRNFPVGVQRLPNGNVVVFTGDKIQEVQPHGERKVVRETWMTHLMNTTVRGENILLLRNGDFAFIVPSGSLVLQASFTGKTCQRFPVEDVFDVAHSGPGLVMACREGRILELHPSGCALWEGFIVGDAWKVRPCLPLVRFGFPEPDAAHGDAASLASRTLLLRHNNPQIRSRAARAVGSFGPAALPSAPELVSLLGDVNRGVSYETSSALRGMGPGVLPIVVDALHHENPRIRAAAAETVPWGCGMRLAVPELTTNLQHADEKVRNKAARALSQIKADVSLDDKRLVALMEDPDWDIRAFVFFALQKRAAQSPDALEALLKASQSKETGMRSMANGALAGSGARDERVLKALIAALKDEQGMVRSRAANALGRMGAPARTATPALVEALFAEDLPRIPLGKEVPANIERALLKIAPGARAVPLLTALLKRPDLNQEQKQQVTAILAGLGGESADYLLPHMLKLNGLPAYHSSFWDALQGSRAESKWALPVLLKGVKQRNLGQDEQTIRLLADIGPEAKDAMPDLLQLLRDPDRSCYAAMALARVAPQDKEVHLALRKVAFDVMQKPEVRGAAIWALGDRSQDASAVKDLLQALEQNPASQQPQSSRDRDNLLRLADSAVSDHYGLRDALFYFDLHYLTYRRGSAHSHLVEHPRLMALLALGNGGPAAVAAIPKLEVIVQDKNGEPAERLCAIWALGQMGPAAKTAAPALTTVLQTPHEVTALREQAAKALKGIGSDAVPELVKVVEGQDWVGRLLAMEALETLGPQARAAQPTLQRLARGEDRLLARAAALALAKVQPR